MGYVFCAYVSVYSCQAASKTTSFLPSKWNTEMFSFNLHFHLTEWLFTSNISRRIILWKTSVFVAFIYLFILLLPMDACLFKPHDLINLSKWKTNTMTWHTMTSNRRPVHCQHIAARLILVVEDNVHIGHCKFGFIL